MSIARSLPDRDEWVASDRTDGGFPFLCNDDDHQVVTLGFPDAARDADLLSRSRRTATGGWVVKLTDAPLDLDNPAHLDALKRAYERFPEIGGRSTP